MTNHLRLSVFLLTAALGLAACGPARQKIPVSTNPIGATIYAVGQKTCLSPCAVSFDKKSDHLITIVKDGYEQVDLEITRQFMPDKAIRDGAITGILKGGTPKDVAGDVAKEVDAQERSGEAYQLTPAIVTMTLTPSQK